MYDCNSGECQQCPHGSYQPQWGNITLHYTMFREHVTHNMCRPDLLLALSSQHHHRRARGLQSGHVQVSRLPLLRQGHYSAQMCAVLIKLFAGGGWHHGVTKLPPTISSQ